MKPNRISQLYLTGILFIQQRLNSITPFQTETANILSKITHSE